MTLPRWGALVFLAVGVSALLVLAPTAPELVVSNSSGGEIARLSLSDGTFALRYRNSLYESTVEERYVVVDDEFRLETLLAEDLAVLEEYYGARPQPADDGWPWKAAPPNEVEIPLLHLAATDLGRRELEVTPNAPVALWRFVSDDDPSVTLRLETR